MDLPQIHQADKTYFSYQIHTNIHSINGANTHTYLSEFGTSLLFFHPSMSNKVIENLAWIEEVRNGHRKMERVKEFEGGKKKQRNKNGR